MALTPTQELQGIAFSLRLLKQAYDKVVIDITARPPPQGDPATMAALTDIATSVGGITTDSASVSAVIGGPVGGPPTAPP